MSSEWVASKEQSKGIKMLLVAVLCLGLNWPGMKLGLEIVSPLWMVCLRFLLSLPILALFVLITKKRLPILNRKDRSVVFVVAFFQFILSMGLITVSLQFIPAGTASILIYTTPLWMLLIDTLWYRHKPHSKRLILTGISTIGCAMILFASGQPGAWLPLFGMLLASALWAVAIRRVSFHKWKGSVIEAVFWQFTIAGAAMLAIALIVEPMPNFGEYGLNDWLLLTYIGPVATGLGFGLMVAAGPKLPPDRIVLISTLTPIVGYVSSVVLLKETLLPLVFAGAVLMISALVVNGLPNSVLKKMLRLGR
ncbi:DMT family transporter [Alteromonas sp. D210916BOD_24]|uniref:DMT family transporter n=1 Tax=Alteromonas sp. D210916BOD_24 TaxID=3157618 RepID=UPI00399CA4FB